jgi:hypothetical protein
MIHVGAMFVASGHLHDSATIHACSVCSLVSADWNLRSLLYFVKGGAYLPSPSRGAPKWALARNLKEVLEGLQFRILTKGVHLKSSSILFPKVDDITDLHHVADQN